MNASARRHGAVLVVAWLVCALLASMFWLYPHDGIHGLDAHAYWATGHRGHLYAGPPAARDAYLYSPAFAMVIWPLTQLPWLAFYVVWVIVESCAFAWLLAPLGWRRAGPLFLLCMIEVSVGNIYGLLAVAAVVGMRAPGAWSFPLLTKVTPGLGPLWFAASRQWRKVAVSLGVTVLIAACSFAVAPHEWTQWFDYLDRNRRNSQWLFPERVAAAALLTVFAGMRRRSWLLAPAMILANPVVIHAWMDLTLLAAIPRLREFDRSATQHLEDHDRSVPPHLTIARRRGQRRGSQARQPATVE